MRLQPCFGTCIPTCLGAAWSARPPGSRVLQAAPSGKRATAEILSASALGNPVRRLVESLMRGWDVKMAAVPTDAGAWFLTVRSDRRVLIMAPTMTSVKRLLDIAGVFAGDLRVRTLFTVPPDVLGWGTEAMLGELGVTLVPWREAVAGRYDLAITVNYGGIAEVDAPLALFSHGASRNKQVKPHGRGAFAVPAPVQGFNRSSLIQNGMLVPSAIAVGHEHELAMLAADCPEALPVARVVGDPCYDRLVAGRPQRAHFRRALGLEPHQTLVVVTSTWTGSSLLGSAAYQLERLVEQLPAPKFRIVLLIHPNAVAAHGAYQLRAWWGHLAAKGLIMTRPEHDWEPLLLAADYIIGDHGSVTLYGATVGVPILVGAYNEADVHHRSGAAALAALAPRLVGSAPVPEQLAHADAQFDATAMANVASLISSEPGGFARHTRSLLYGMLGLGQPATPARLADAAELPPLWQLARDTSRTAWTGGTNGYDLAVEAA